MKKLANFLIPLFSLFTICLTAQTKISTNQKDYQLFGEKFTIANVLTEKQMLQKYRSLKKGDSIAVKFVSTIKSVCKKKGCWMNLILDKESNAFVKFKDYGFFMPLNVENSLAIVNGKAFVEIVTVAEQQHYAKDAGKTKAEIDQIKKPEITYSFKADGVYLR